MTNPIAPNSCFVNSDIEWYYSTAGQRKGPVSETELLDLIKTGTIDRESLIWNASLPDWQPLSFSKLALAITSPPPLSGDAVSNGVVWLLAFCPIIGGLLQILLGPVFHQDSSLTFLGLALNVIVSFWDQSRLEKAGVDISKCGGAWLIPVYLFRRRTLLRQKSALYPWVWCALFVLSIFLF